MKLEKLIIDNIASIEHAEIDFTADPLADEPVFLICGPTGAGKSTILDSICLALYNSVPRLENAPADPYVDQLSGYAGKEKDGGAVSIDDTRMLLRRGAGECSVELTFTDDNNTRYTATWGCHHARKKINGKVSAVEWQLRDNHGLYLTKKGEVAEAIEKAVGMNFEQFRRTTMLAQGEFARFLTSSADSKSEILEKLTGTSHYSNIGRRIAEHTKSLKDAIELLKARINSTVLLKPDEIESRNSRLIDCNKAIEAKRQTQKTTDELIKNLADEEHTATELATAIERRNGLKLTMESDDFTARSADIALWDITEPLRSAIAMARQQNDRLSRARGETADTRKFAEARGASEALAQQLADATSRAATADARLKKLASLKPLFDDLSLIRNRASNHTANLRSIAAASAEIKTRLADIDRLTADMAGRKKALDETETQRQSLDRQVGETAEALEALKPDDVNNRHSQARSRLQLAENAVTLIKSVTLAAEELETASRDLAEAKTSLEKARTTVAECKVKADDAEASLEKARQLFEHQRETTADYLKELRATLHEGEICPLCGQKILKLTSTESFESLLKPLHDNLQLAQSRQQEQQRKLSDATAALLHIEQSLPKYDLRMTKATTRLETSRRQADANPIAKSLLADDAAAAENRIEAIINEARSDFERVDREQQLINKTNATLQELQRKLAEKTAACQKQSAEIAATGQEIAAANATLSAKRAELNRLTEENRSIAEGFAQLLDPVEHNDETARLTALKTAIASWADGPTQPPQPTQPRREAATQPSGAARLNLGEANPPGFEKIAETLASLQTNAMRLDEQSKGIADEIAAITAATRRCSETESQILQLRPEWGATPPHATTATQTSAQTAIELWDSLKSEVERINERIKTYTVALEEANASIESFKALHPQIDINRLNSLSSLPPMTVETWRKEQADTIAAARQTDILIAQLTGKAEQIKKRIPADHEPVDTLRRLSEQLQGEIASLLTEKGAIEEQLRADAKQRRLSSETLRELDEKRQIHDRWSRLNTLFGSSDGKRMRNIAQSWMLSQLTNHANHYLRQLSPRYELVTQPGLLTLLIRDKDAGGDLRPATNLSGGESFVVSLALALGLPSLSGRVMALDVIFIDEGFGTLDSQIRNTVIDTLERLHSLGGRRVGLISHVESLRERIPVKIEVTRRAETLSEVKVYRS